MSVAVQCPNPACGAHHHVSEKAIGRRARCPRCGQDFTLAGATLPDAPAAGETMHDRSAEPPRGQTAAFELTSALPLPSAAASQSEPAGSSLPTRFSRFEIRSRIGAGATGVVYRAFDPLLGRDVAIKVPNEAALDSPQAVARFLREPKAAAQLRHPHIVPVYDAGADQGRYYIASAYIEGHTLERQIADDRPDFRRAAEIVLDLADALYYAHGLGVVHRDVKPANIMLDARGDALLMDFGLARVEAGEKLTHDGTVLGTPGYMAPEQASVELGEVGPASDQYSLGVVLYELLCGERPFHGPPAVVIFHVLNEQPRAPRAIDSDVPRDLETIALKAMSKRPADRYADCRALADDLRRWLEDRPIVARQMGPIERTVRWAKKRPALAALAATVLLSAVVSTWFAFALERRGTDLRRALADSQAHAERVEKANATIRERDATLEQREAALQAAEQEISMAREALDVERQQVAAKDQELERQLDENERVAKERDVAQSAKETAEEAAKEAATARDEVVKSDVGWALYKRKLLAAQAALQQGNDAEAITLLRACPKEHRAWEWKVLWSRSHGGATTWSWSGADESAMVFSPIGRHLTVLAAGQGGVLFSPSGKLLAVHIEPGKIGARAERPAQSAEALLKLFDSATGREIDSIPITRLASRIPRLGTWALHPDGKTIAMVTGGTTVIERQLGPGGVDAALVSAEPRSIEWIGYHPDGAQLYFVERGTDEIVVRSIHRTNKQLVQVAVVPAFRETESSMRAANATNVIRWPGGTFTPDGHFFLFFSRGSKVSKLRYTWLDSVLNIENNYQLALPGSSQVFSKDLSIAVAQNAQGVEVLPGGSIHSRPGFSIDRTAVLGLPRAVAEKEPVQAVRCAFEGDPIAISPDGKRLACTTNDQSLAIWNITSPTPLLWEEVIAFDGPFFKADWIVFSVTVRECHS